MADEQRLRCKSNGTHNARAGNDAVFQAGRQAAGKEGIACPRFKNLQFLGALDFLHPSCIQIGPNQMVGMQSRLSKLVPQKNLGHLNKWNYWAFPKSPKQAYREIKG